jgi:ribonuclease P protein component
MLPAANRLRTAAEFRETSRGGAKVARGCVVVYLSTGHSPDPPRVGLVVGKSVGGSVIRHRTARRIRGAVAGIVPGLPAGSRIVIRALPGADHDPELPSCVALGITAALERAARS